jgi:hypothetical protein
MTLRETIYYTAVCDLCGRDNDTEYSAWSSTDGANEDAEESEWHVEGGNHICDDCGPRPLEILDEDEIDPGHGTEGHNCYAERNK